MLSWKSLKGISEAVDLLIEARSKNSKVVVVGDYDTDGATSTALAMMGLQAFGINVTYVLPNRFEYGYGLSPEIVSLVLTQNPDLIITVDNGIASFDGVEKAREAGVKVLITDHHLAGNKIPAADAIINPNQPDCLFPSKAACGCTVLYYLLIALRARLRNEGQTELPNLGEWLDLVALATVADVVPLDDSNRRLVQQGLNRIRAGRCRPGIKALFEVAGREVENAQSSDFGFVLGPRLNAAGRLDDMTRGVELLLTNSLAEARVIASELQDLNVERRQIEASMLQDVEHFLAPLTIESNKFGCVVQGDDWHEGVIGILASRVKDKVHRPVVAFANSDEGFMKGSARSIPGVHLKDCLDWMTKKQPDLIVKYGGHAMAAGMTIEKQHLAQFEEWFDLAVQHFSEADDLTPHLWVDGQLQASALSLENAKIVESAGPWGQAFSEPQFYGEWEIESQRILADKHLKIEINANGSIVSCIAFNVDLTRWPTTNRRLKAVYQLNCNRFRGKETLQLMLSKIEPC
jgi:single-stranded-DNA-specific exonuclease